MNASILLSLYPRDWRARYEAEFRAMLEEHPPTAAQALDIALGAIDAHLRARPSAAGAVPPPDPATVARRREALHAVFFAHAALFIAVMSILALVTFFFTPGQLWVLYPLWAWGTLLATHAAATFQWKGLLGAHLVLYTGLNAGLVAINITQGGPPWAIWPILGLGIPLASHALVSLGGATLLRAHAVATGLALAVLALVAIATRFDALAGIVIGAAMLGVLLVAHGLMRNLGWSLLRAHLFVYAASLALLLVDNLVTDPGEWWVQYPFAMWTVLLVGHALIQRRHQRWSGAWERAMLEELGARGEPDRQKRLVGAFLMHVSLFLAAAVGFVLLDLLGGEGSWAAWPIGAWYALLALHAGYVLSPRRWIGSLLFGWVAAAAGLVAIDLATAGGPWWYWPVVWSTVPLALLAGALWTRDRPWVGAHIVGGLALAGALVVTDVVTGPPAWWFFPVAAIIVSWLIHFIATMNLPRMLGASSGARR
jgi:hypothetical protein